ncbi:MAG: 3-methyl-2-oxobutanoate dehydrogenase subunit VorB [Desulfovibrionaceae bacterium]|nr:3-methyl-2-oxobutanoate dehydrogenase subunit VorB [Desulfovibrionaceae bacterium]
MEDKKIFIRGNEAVCYGALSAGARCYFGYPITPQSEIPEMMSKAMPEAGGSFVQAESELAAASMLMGAAAAGVRAFTSSSSPGVSLMQECISYMSGSQLPAVIVNMNRGGPGLGDIGSAQGDYYQATRGGGHGDYRTLTLAPSGCQEAHDMMIRAFDLAFKYRNPVLVLGDGVVGTMKEPVRLWTPSQINSHAAASWQVSGAAGREKHVLKSLYLLDGVLAAHNRKLQEKFAAMRAETEAECVETADASLVVVAYGSIGRIAKSAVRLLRSQGLKVGLVRPITLYPFPDKVLQDLAEHGKKFLTIEHNCGQMVDDVRLAIRGYADSDFHGHMPGAVPAMDDFIGPIEEAARRTA